MKSKLAAACASVEKGVIHATHVENFCHVISVASCCCCCCFCCCCCSRWAWKWHVLAASLLPPCNTCDCFWVRMKRQCWKVLCFSSGQWKRVRQLCAQSCWLKGCSRRRLDGKGRQVYAQHTTIHWAAQTGNTWLSWTQQAPRWISVKIYLDFFFFKKNFVALATLKQQSS